MEWCWMGACKWCALAAVAHNQHVHWAGRALAIDTKVAIYDAKVTKHHEHYMLTYHNMTAVIQIPVNMLTYKEVAAGIGPTCLDVEDWTARWNDRVDHEAAVAHALRDPQIEQSQCADLRRLADFHGELAEQHFIAPVEHALEDENTHFDLDPAGLMVALQHGPWQRGLPEPSPLDWRVVQVADRFGWTFTQSMFAWLQGCAAGEAAVAFQMSYLELAVHMGSG